MRDESAVEYLTGGRSTHGVVRIGDSVHRPTSSNATFVHALLRHLERTGFAAAPRFCGVDERGWEMLTYIEGVVPHNASERRWTDDQLRRVAALLRTFHDATAGTELAGPHEVVCHNDFAPWNVVLVNEIPAAMIDFDEAAPGSRIRDVSYAVWCWLNLGDERFAAEEQGRRIRLFCDEYGLTDRDNLIAEFFERQREIHAKHAAKGHQDRVAGVAAERVWCERHHEQLQAAITSR